MKLPDGLLRGQFVSQMVRGAVIRVEFDAWDDKAKTEPGPKYAVVLNNPSVLDPFYLALATSKVAFYEKSSRFDADILRLSAGDYKWVTLPTVIAFRGDPVAMSRHKLEAQIVAEKLLFEGNLTNVHLERVNQIIAGSQYITPNLVPHISP